MIGRHVQNTVGENHLLYYIYIGSITYLDIYKQGYFEQDSVR